jgi:hypothetical protein
MSKRPRSPLVLAPDDEKESEEVGQRLKQARIDPAASRPLAEVAFENVALPLDVLRNHILPLSNWKGLYTWSLTCWYMAKEWPLVIVTIPERITGRKMQPFFRAAIPRMRNVKSIENYDHITYYLLTLPADARITHIATRGTTYFNEWPWSPAQRLPHLERLDIWFDARDECRRPEYFTGLTALRELRIRQDRDTLDGDRLITQVGGLAHLTKLVIDQNTRTTDVALRHLTALRELKLLYKCFITDAGLAARAPTLTRLVIGYGSTRDLPFTAAGIGALTNLRSLTINTCSGWQPDGLGDTLGELTTLRTLVLGHYPSFLGRQAGSLSFLSLLAGNLETFELRYDFPVGTARDVATLTRLKELRLVDWSTAQPPAHEGKEINDILASMSPSVESLVLRGEAARATGRQTIMMLMQLRSLKIGKFATPKIPFPSYKKLLRYLPHLTVYSTTDGDLSY